MPTMSLSSNQFRVILTVGALVIVLAAFLGLNLQASCKNEPIGTDDTTSKLLLETQQELSKARQELEKTKGELKLAESTIIKLKQDVWAKTNNNDGTNTEIPGCSPGSLKKLHKHINDLVKYFERTVMDYRDDLRGSTEQAKKILKKCKNKEAVEAANKIIHFYRYRYDPEYGNPLGRKPYFSGEGECGIDRMVEIFVDSKENGVFLELGGLSGREGNTRYFDHHKNWTGVLFEAGKVNWEVGKKFREPTPFYRVAIWNQTGKLVDSGTYQHMMGDLSYNAGAGLVAVCAPLAPGEQPPAETDEASPCYSIDYLLAGNPPVKEVFGEFDYVSLDCEGCEIHVIEKWDFQKNPSSVFTIENHEQLTPPPQWRRIVEIMRENGYVWMFTFFDGFFLNTRKLYGVEPDAFGYQIFWAGGDSEWTRRHRRRLARMRGERARMRGTLSKLALLDRANRTILG